MSRDRITWILLQAVAAAGGIWLALWLFDRVTG